MGEIATEWTLEGFVDHFDFVHHRMLDHKFVWVLGAGASYASGIPLGSELVDGWLKEIHLREDGTKTPIAKWATAETLEIVGFRFEDRASLYPKIYQRRFQNYPEEGYAYLEGSMSGKDPSPGYSILAAALAADPPRHNVVITTNFDNLVADALSIYTDTFPFVAGHESLTGFVRVAMRRPLICKIHRDLLMGPQNEPRSLRRLHDAWGLALRSLFQHYTPIFIGYGGNDDTLMDLLESMQKEDIKGQAIWCYFEGGKTSERVRNLIADLKGVMVPVPDFDLLMILLGERMQIGLLDEEINTRAKARAKRYRDRVQLLDTVKHPTVTKALAATFGRSGGWWAWVQKARTEKEPARSETVYRQGLDHYPMNAELHATFAVFLQERKKYDEAEKLFKKAIKLESSNPHILTNYAIFLLDIRSDFQEAEKLFRQSLKVDSSALTLGNYTELLIRAGRYEEATKMLRRAKSADKGDDEFESLIQLFYEGILARLRGQDDTEALNELSERVQHGFSPPQANLRDLLEYLASKLSAEDRTLYAAVAKGLLEPKNFPELEALLKQRVKAKKASRKKHMTAKSKSRRRSKSSNSKSA